MKKIKIFSRGVNPDDELVNGIKNTSVYSKTGGSTIIKFKGANQANKDTEKKFANAKHKLEAINSYIRDRNTQSLKALLKKSARRTA